MKFFRKKTKQDMQVDTFYEVHESRGGGEVNFRMGNLWTEGNRYPGDWMMRRHESGGLEITFNGTTHRSKPVVKIIAPEHVDKFILSSLECRGWDE